MRYFTLNNFNLTRKIVKNFLVEKTCENATVLRYLTFDNFNLTRKIVKKFLVEKTREIEVEHYL